MFGAVGFVNPVMYCEHALLYYRGLSQARVDRCVVAFVPDLVLSVAPSCPTSCPFLTFVSSIHGQLLGQHPLGTRVRRVHPERNSVEVRVRYKGLGVAPLHEGQDPLLASEQGLWQDLGRSGVGFENPKGLTS